MHDPLAEVLAYHERTRHGFDRAAPGPGRMDWSTEPDPFRRFAGSPIERLDRFDDDCPPPYDLLFAAALPPAPVDRTGLSRWLYFALAISAWKEHGGTRWSLRVNPSSGDLHPTECYLVTAALGRPGLYHYAPREHALELRAELDAARCVPSGGLLAVLTSVIWRESWKYGERAFRYCQQDLGHALAALRLSAAMLGWRASVVASAGDEEIARLVGLDRDDAGHPGEEESPALALAVVPRGAEIDPAEFRLADPAAVRWHGRANRLSPRHRDWPAITAAERACRRAGRAVGVERVEPRAATPGPEPRRHSAGTIIRRRRSALALDGVTRLGRADFWRALLRVLPDVTPCPFDALHWKPLVHLGLFVHRVDGLVPGLYVLVRDRERVEELRRAMRGDFVWTVPPQRPAELPLFLLAEGDVRAIAIEASCDQDMAGDGVFCAAMLAHFEPELRRRGAAFYRNLHWEAGVVAHVLYLEAEAAGLRGTGMGCFLDHASHGAFGIRDLSLQTLYHFTAGGPIEDRRLTTLPAYGDVFLVSGV
jgi:SagB-type dehydrogenase family enzyme